MKKLLIYGGSAVVLILAGVAIVPSFIDWNASKGMVRDKIAEATGYDVQIDGNLGFAVLPAPYFYVENVTISPPEGYQGDAFVSLDRLDVSVALLPLFTGTVSVDAVKLVNPLVTLETTKEGRFAALNPKLEAMLEPGAQDAAAPANNGFQSVSLNSISITGGQVTMINHQTGQNLNAKAIDMNLSAKSLKGPFDASGSLDFNGSMIDFKASTGAMAEGQTTSLNLQANVNKAAEIQYSGVVDFANLTDLQGETSLSILSFASLTNQPDAGAALAGFEPVVVKGLLTAKPGRLGLKNSSLKLGAHEFEGDISVALDPLDVVADFTSKKPLNINDYMPKGNAGKSSAASGTFLSALPDTISLPADFSAQITLSAPAALYQTQSFGDVKLTFTKKDKQFEAQIAAAKIPGQGSFDMKGALSFAGQSVDKASNAAIFSDPTLQGSIDLKTQNLSQTLEVLPGASSAAIPAGIKSADISADILADAKKLSIKAGSFRTEGMSASFSGAYEPGNSTRDKLTIDIALDKLDTAKFKSDKPAPAASLEETLKSLAFPYDLAFDVGVQSLVMDGQNIEGVRIQGALAQNSLTLTNLSAQNYAGLEVKVDGKIADLKALSGIDMNVAGQSADVKSVMQHFKMDTSALPAKLSAANVNVSASGDVNKLKTKAQIRALEAEIIASGDVLSPLTDLKTQGLSLQVKHPNLANFLRTLSPGSDYYSGLAKPLDFSADIAVEGKVTSLKNMKTSLAGTPVNGSLQYDTSQSIPLLKGALDIGDFVMQPVSAPSGVARVKAQSTGQGGAVGTRWSSTPMNNGWMRSMNMDMDIKAKSFVNDPWSLSNVTAKITLQDGTLSVQNLKAGVLQGQMAASFVAASAPAAAGPLAIQGNVDFQAVSLENLMSNLIGSQLIRGQGLVNFKADIKGNGASQSAIVSSLSGNAVTNGQNIVIDGLDLSKFAQALSAENKPGDTLLGLWKGTVSGGSTKFNTMDGVFPISQGVVNIQKLDLLGPQANITTTGAVNLPRWTIQTAHTITLPMQPGATEAPPPFTVNISGPLDNPAQTFGQGAINDYISRKINRKLEKLITDKLGEKLGLPSQQTPAPAPAPDGSAPAPQQQQQQQQQQQKPEDAIKGLLEGLMQ
jgi:uncharacterized protein involved in outer membrane biogenesis